MRPSSPLDASAIRYCEIKAGSLQPQTVCHSRYTLRSFVRFLQTRDPAIRVWSDVRRHPHIEDWLSSLHGVKAISRIKYLGIVEQFFYEIRQWHWADPPEEGLFVATDMPKAPRRLPKPLDEDSDRQLRAALEAEPSVRNLGLLLLRETGLRIGELLSLPLDAARPNRQGQWDLKVPLGKTRAERLFPLLPRAVSYIEGIVRRRGLRVPGRELPDRLMVDERGRILNYMPLHDHLQYMAEKAGLRHWRRVHPHQLRHTFATELARLKMPLPSLMRLLGHSRPGITMQYVELTSTDVRQAYEQAVSRLSTIAAVVPAAPEVSEAQVPLRERLGLFVASLERERRDLPGNAPQADSLRRLVRKLQATLRTMKPQSP